MPKRNDYQVRPDALIAVLSILLVIVGVFAIFWSRQVVQDFARDVWLGLGLALAPSGILGLIADWFVFGGLMADLRQSTSDLQEETMSLESEIRSLRVSTNFLKRSSDLGLEMIYPDRSAALKDFALYMRDEAQRSDKEGRLIIVGSSIKGLLETVKETTAIIRNALKNNCVLSILMTHPEYSQYRENQEDRPTGAIEDEIFEGIRDLESSVEIDFPEHPDQMLSPVLKLYKGTPTCFMIVAGDHMMINPYPYEEEAYKSFCVAVRRVEPRTRDIDIEQTIYAQYMRAHFEKPWNRNAVPYRHYWLEGPDPSASWDRKSCYGDVFVVQDAGHFYLAVYLQGQRQADVRGLPTSIPCTGSAPGPSCLVVPSEFSVRLFGARTHEWESLDDKMGLLSLHAERRRGKLSHAMSGSMLNDYLMLGLFDPAGKVTNPHKHDESAVEGLGGQQLPIFWVWLGKRQVNTQEDGLWVNEASVEGAKLAGQTTAD